MFLLVISRPNDTEPSMGSVPVNGAVNTGTLLRIWGRVFSGPAPASPFVNPWDDSSGDPVGPAIPSGGNWDLGTIVLPSATSSPGAVNHVIVWGVFDDNQSFVLETKQFTLESGSGSGSGSGGMLAAKWLFEAAPRVYRVGIESFAGTCVSGPEAMEVAQQLATGSVFVAYDEAASLPQEPVWREVGTSQPWRLQLKVVGCDIQATLTRARCSMADLVWQSSQWKFRGRQLLLPQYSSCGTQLPTLYVEPV